MMNTSSEPRRGPQASIPQKYSPQIHQLLRDLIEEAPEVVNAAVISQDGILLGTNLEGEAREDKFALMAASMISLATNVAHTLKVGGVQQICLKSTLGLVIIRSIEERGTLCCLANEEAKLGSILLDMKKTSAKLAQYVYPINYGTGLLNPRLLEEYEESMRQKGMGG